MSSPVKADVVLFNEICKSYLPGEKLEVSYTIQDDSDLKPASRDWVGLFRVGWASSRDYYTFVWVTLVNEENKKGAVSFAGRRLPPEDKHFYQFCYVSSAGRVRGASSPFQFSSVPTVTTSVDDLELVEVSEDSLMLVQSKEKVMTSANTNAKNGSGAIENEASENLDVSKAEMNEDSSLTWKFEMVEREVVQKTELLDVMDKKITDMELQLQAKRESETRLMEKLEKEKARSHLLESSSSNKEAECLVITNKLAEYESQITHLQEKNENLVWENGKLKETLSSLDADFETSKRKLRELQEVEVELMTQIGEKNQELEDLNVQMAQMKLQQASEIKVLNQKMDQVSEELIIAQQNIAELLGAKTSTIVSASSEEGGAMANNDVPPTLPVPREGMVDRSVYEALQRACENMEQYYYKATEDNKGLLTHLQVIKSKLDTAVRKNAEHVHRIEKCRYEYETKVKEVLELQRMVKVGSMAGNGMGVHDELTSLRAKLRDMAENQEQMEKSWDEAIKELTLRKAELKQKAIKLAEMDGCIMELQDELHVLRKEHDDFQDRHDKVNYDKTAKIDEQQHFLEAKNLELADLRAVVAGFQKEKPKLESTVKMLRAQLDSLKASVKTTEEKACPICNTKFPNRISQQEFENHVQAHFTSN